jgi:hypothetical protein
MGDFAEFFSSLCSLRPSCQSSAELVRDLDLKSECLEVFGRREAVCQGKVILYIGGLSCKAARCLVLTGHDLQRYQISLIVDELILDVSSQTVVDFHLQERHTSAEGKTVGFLSTRITKRSSRP